MPGTSTSKPIRNTKSEKSKTVTHPSVGVDGDQLNQQSGFLALPFVHRSKCDGKNSSNWHVPPTKDYEQACQRGHEYAAHFVRYLQDPAYAFGVNAFGHIVKDIDFNDNGHAKGYWVGFFSYLERLLHAQDMDVFADVAQINGHLTMRSKL